MHETFNFIYRRRGSRRVNAPTYTFADGVVGASVTLAARGKGR
jgi:hypothetical protein